MTEPWDDLSAGILREILARLALWTDDVRSGQLVPVEVKSSFPAPFGWPDLPDPPSLHIVAKTPEGSFEVRFVGVVRLSHPDPE